MEKKVLAIVNGREITEGELVDAMSRFPQEKRNSFNTEEGKKQLLEQIIAWELLYNHAVDQGFEKRQDYMNQLEEARKAILTQLAIQDAISGIKVQDDEVKKYYDENQNLFYEEEKISAKHILVDSEYKAKDVLEVINGGMTFEEAARLYSSCPSKENGGNLGYFGRGMMVPEFENAAFGLEIGEISNPVKTQFGYHLIVVNDKVAPELKSYEEVKDIIAHQMAQDKQNRVYFGLVNDLEKKYKIERK